MSQSIKTAVPNKSLAAVCGLFCASCTYYIATTEDPGRLAFLAQRRGISANECRCEGCRSDQRNPFCATCKMSACAAGKGIDFCVQCDEYPCEDLQTFQAAAPHRIELWASQARIQEASWETWYVEQAAAYRCPNCDTTNSAYDIKCRQCGVVPGSDYVNRHMAQITEYMQQRK